MSHPRGFPLVRDNLSCRFIVLQLEESKQLDYLDAIKLEIIADTMEGKYMNQFKSTVFIPLVCIAIQFLDQGAPLDLSPLDHKEYSSSPSESWKSATLALFGSPFILIIISGLTGNKYPTWRIGSPPAARRGPGPRHWQWPRAMAHGGPSPTPPSL